MAGLLIIIGGVFGTTLGGLYGLVGGAGYGFITNKLLSLLPSPYQHTAITTNMIVSSLGEILYVGKQLYNIDRRDVITHILESSVWCGVLAGFLVGLIGSGGLI